MTAGAVCTRDVVIVRRGETLATAAREMLEEHVGTVVVIEDRDGTAVPVGLITDRDLVRAQLRHDADLRHLSVEQVMTRNLLCLTEHEPLSSALERMKARAVRRAPVVNDAGALIGILSVDDLIELIAEQAAALAGLIERQRRLEPPAVTSESRRPPLERRDSRGSHHGSSSLETRSHRR